MFQTIFVNLLAMGNNNIETNSEKIQVYINVNEIIRKFLKFIRLIFNTAGIIM